MFTCQYPPVTQVSVIAFAANPKSLQLEVVLVLPIATAAPVVVSGQPDAAVGVPVIVVGADLD